MEANACVSRKDGSLMYIVDVGNRRGESSLVDLQNNRSSQHAKVRDMITTKNLMDHVIAFPLH